MRIAVHVNEFVCKTGSNVPAGTFHKMIATAEVFLQKHSRPCSRRIGDAELHPQVLSSFLPSGSLKVGRRIAYVLAGTIAAATTSWWRIGTNVNRHPNVTNVPEGTLRQSSVPQGTFLRSQAKVVNRDRQPVLASLSHQQERE